MTFDLYFINLNSCRGNYSREETIQGRKLFAEIRYALDVSKLDILNPLLFRIERSGLILSISSDYKSVYPNGCSDCDIIEAWHQRGMIPTNCTHFVAGNDTGSDPGSFPRGHVDVN